MRKPQDPRKPSREYHAASAIDAAEWSVPGTGTIDEIDQPAHPEERPAARHRFVKQGFPTVPYPDMKFLR